MDQVDKTAADRMSMTIAGLLHDIGKRSYMFTGIVVEIGIIRKID